MSPEQRFERVRRLAYRAKFRREMRESGVPRRLWRFVESGENLFAYSPDGRTRTPLGYEGPPERFDPVSQRWAPIRGRGQGRAP